MTDLQMDSVVMFAWTIPLVFGYLLKDKFSFRLGIILGSVFLYSAALVGISEVIGVSDNTANSWLDNEFGNNIYRNGTYFLAWLCVIGYFIPMVTFIINYVRYAREHVPALYRLTSGNVRSLLDWMYYDSTATARIRVLSRGRSTVQAGAEVTQDVCR